MLGRIFSVSVLSATLAACGGGGGASNTSAASTPASTAITISSTNDRQVASVGAGAGSAASGVASRSFSAGWSSLPQHLVDQIQQYANVSKRSELRAVQQFDDACFVSGSRNITFNDTDNNGLPGAGDTVSITLIQCNDGDGSVANGSMSIVFNACSPSFSGGTCEANTLNIDLTMSDITGIGTIKGAMTSVFQSDINFSMGNDHVTSSDLTFSFGNESVHFQDLVSDSSWDDNAGIYSDATDFTLDLNVTGFVGRLIVDNTIPMESSGFYPDTGSTTITGSGGTTVVLNADTGDLNTVQVVTNGGAPQLFTWVELEQQSPIPSFF